MYVMRVFLCLLVLGALFLPGCATQSTAPESREQVLYYDRNGDGRVDQEKHHFWGGADADWELRDDDYNGRYEKKILHGFALTEWGIDLPVPTNVPIEPKP